MASGSEYLVISRVGEASLHSSWLSGSDREFDVWLSAYSDRVAAPNAAGVGLEYRPGSKIRGYHGVFVDHPWMFDRYRYIALIDDDISAATEDLNKMFRLCDRHELKMAQPALTADSYFTYAFSIRQPFAKRRAVNFIEMMVPFFRSDVLASLVPLFDLGFESGIDLAWCSLAGGRPRDFAIVDEVAVRHTRQIGLSKNANGFTDGRTYDNDIAEVLERFGIAWYPAVPKFIVLKNGGIFKSKSIMFISALTGFRSIVFRRALRYRLRAVLTHLRHVVTRKWEIAERANVDVLRSDPRETSGAALARSGRAGS